MTNSPPHNVNLGPGEAPRVLASGIDSLVLAFNVVWKSDATFQDFGRLKQRAKNAQEDEPARLKLDAGGSCWTFNVKPHGAGGYEWLLVSRELAMKVGNWRYPKQRPSVMVDIRAETLWTFGPEIARQRVVTLLQALGADIVSEKPSRADLCMDILIREEDWSLGLLDRFVTRAHNVSPWIHRKLLSGFTIGSGVFQARLYDKGLEIRVKSHKFWMYDIWGIEIIPEGYLVIRVEFQIRREPLHDFHLDSWAVFTSKLQSLWGYCTIDWLRLVNDAKMHHTQQILLPLWAVVMREFAGQQAGEPLVRKKAIRQDLRQLAAQMAGFGTSISTILADDEDFDSEVLFDADSHLGRSLEIAKRHTRMTDKKFTAALRKKRARYRRPRPESST